MFKYNAKDTRCALNIDLLSQKSKCSEPQNKGFSLVVFLLCIVEFGMFMEKRIQGKLVETWLRVVPILKDIASLRSSFWINQKKKPFQGRVEIDFNSADVNDAANRLERFRPYLAEAFPETRGADGKIESPLLQIPLMQEKLFGRYQSAPGRLFIKLDSHLPISGSIKARGGIYEILKFAETTALSNRLLDKNDNYVKLSSPECRDLFAKYSIAVGSTGNLGLSIGIIGIKLGFAVTVHMSADAKQWKKDKLRSLGVHVVEHEADYSVAVAKGRAEAESDPHCHFVDDEDSRDLFLGYAVAGEGVKKQLEQQAIFVDEDHPLFVYLPCGVGGGPGGITYGLKLAFGDNVHCFFGEPTQAPAMLVGLATGLHDNVSATDFGVENQTIADGLAVSRPSGLVSRTMQHMLDGIFTVADEEMYKLLTLLAESEGIRLEPSALVGFSGYCRITKGLENTQWLKNVENASHLVWATGGSMVPDLVWHDYNEQGIKHLENSEFV